MKVTVSLITYNHAPFIAQAIESVLMQQTRFDFELLIGEDESTDGTREIVRSYHAKYPGRIRLLLHDRKNVVFINGKPTGQWNFANNVSNSRGEYVALLDGDDYWTSPLKLQKQADYLDQNSDCAMCFHNVEILDESDPGRLVPQYRKRLPPKYSLETLLKGNFMHTCSVMFRSGLFGEFPPWFFKSPFGDWPLHVLNAQHGRIGYLDEILAVYRKHAGGVLSGQERMAIVAATVQSAEQIRNALTPEQRLVLDERLVQWRMQLASARGDDQEAGKLGAEYYRRFLFRTKTQPWRVFRLLAKTKIRAALGARGE
jgi:glycosyltransferase involved in cell wall biosynthesis